MAGGQSLPSDGDQGFSSQNVDPDGATTHDENQHASTLEHTDSITVVPGLDNNLNSVDKLALVSSVSLSHKSLLISNRTLQKLWNV